MKGHFAQSYFFFLVNYYYYVIKDDIVEALTDTNFSRFFFLHLRVLL